MFTEPNISGGIINTLFALIFAINLVAIVWGIAVYFTEMGSDEGKKEGKELILQSITWLVVFMCIYALVTWVRNAVGF